MRAVVIVTSDKCYENREWVWGYRENEPMGGFDPYSSSKGCVELVTAAYRNSFFSASRHAEHGVAIATARAGNVIGGGDWAADRLVPDCMRAIEAGKPVVLRCPDGGAALAARAGTARRLPAARRTLLRRWRGSLPRPGIRPDAAVDATGAQIVDTTARLRGTVRAWQDAPAGDSRTRRACSRLDSARAREALGWRPRWSLATRSSGPSLASGLVAAVPTWPSICLSPDRRPTRRAKTAPAPRLADIVDSPCGACKVVTAQTDDV